MYTLPELPYAYDALGPWCDAATLELHHDKHHRAYVDAANEAVSALREVDPDDLHEVTALRAALTFNLGGHVLHSLFWENLCPEPAPPTSSMAHRLDEDFGSFDRFRQLFSRACAGVQGSGWGALIIDPLEGGLQIATIHDHHMELVPNAGILAVVDVWEHAYYLDHQNRRPEWVDAAVEHLNWQAIAQRCDRMDRSFAEVA